MRRFAAVFEISLNIRIVASMAIHKATITISPKRGDLSPKKAIDQSEFRINCKTKIIIDLFAKL